MKNAQEYLKSFERLPRPYRFIPASRDRAHQREADIVESNTREFASANLHHLLPDIPMSAHPQIIDEILMYRLMAELDEDGLFLLDNTDIQDSHSVLAAAKSTPVIFCTFHFGSYRLINMLLMSRSFNYLLPVEDHIYTAQKAIFLNHSDGYKKHFHSTSQFVVVNADNLQLY